jgi:hypothetical protein
MLIVPAQEAVNTVLFKCMHSRCRFLTSLPAERHSTIRRSHSNRSEANKIREQFYPVHRASVNESRSTSSRAFWCCFRLGVLNSSSDSQTASLVRNESGAENGPQY